MRDLSLPISLAYKYACVVCENVVTKNLTEAVCKNALDRIDNSQFSCYTVCYTCVCMQVGCGAIGCEMLKNYAMLGVGCRPNGMVCHY